MRCRLLLVALLVCPLVSRADDHIVFDATIAGKPARMAFDTGAPRTILYRTAAIRLGLHIYPPLTVQNAADSGIVGLTEKTDFVFGSTPAQEEFLVMEIPPGLRPEFDGLIGWAPIRETRILFRGELRRLETPRDFPDEVAGWTKFPVRRSSVLLLEVTMPDGVTGVFLVDTGSEYGLELNEQLWNEWVSKHPDQPETMRGFFTPSAGITSAPERWADEYKLGPITLRDLPITLHKTKLVGVEDYLGTIGLAALMRMDLAVDGQDNVAHVQPISAKARPYTHNRLGASFVPRSPTDDALIAHVGQKSPAARAGIREGDALLRIEQLDVTKWRTDPKVLPISRFFEMSAGTKLNLTLQRDGQEMTIPVTLEEIIGPSTHPAG